jgi:hypothetical protein
MHMAFDYSLATTVRRKVGTAHIPLLCFLCLLWLRLFLRYFILLDLLAAERLDRIHPGGYPGRDQGGQ